MNLKLRSRGLEIGLNRFRRPYISWGNIVPNCSAFGFVGRTTTVTLEDQFHVGLTICPGLSILELGWLSVTR